MSKEILKPAEMIAKIKPIVDAAEVTVVDGKPTLSNDPFKAAQAAVDVSDNELIKVRRFVSAYGAVAHEKVMRVGVDMMKADKELSKVDGVIGLGEFRKAESRVNRVHEGKSPKTQEPITTYGTNRLSLSIISGQDSSAINEAIANIKAYGAEQLKG